MDMIRRMILLLTGILMAVGAFAGGKTFCVVGDSYVRNHLRPASEAWHAKVAAKLGYDYVNCGINGNCIAFDRSDRGFGRPLVERVGELPDSVDVLLLIAGHNDADMIANNDCYNLRQFSDALDSVLKQLKKKYPDAAIGYVTPWHVDRPYFPEVISEIKTVCAANGIPVLDSATSGIDVNNPEFRQQYFQSPDDTAHLNNQGHDLIVDWGFNFVTTLLK